MNRDRALQIVQVLRKAGFMAYWAGGCVRDLIMKSEPQDYDVATSASTDDIERLFEKTVPVGKQFGVVLVLLDGQPFEVATFRTEGDYQDGRHPAWVKPAGPEADARRRDFTINGLFFDPVAQEVIDYVHGQQDIAAGLIRAIGDPRERFAEDKLRILRAVRFASVLNFTVEKETWNTVKAMAREIHSVSAERIREELIKIFTRPNAGSGLQLLSDSGLLREILPEVEAMKGCRQNPEFHPEGDVFVHTKLLLDKLENPTITLAFGALLHDVGKPPTFSDEGGKIHFYEHDRVGAEMTRVILTRLKFSTREVDAVCEAVGSHMRFMNVQEMRKGKLKTFMARENFPEELELHKIDCGSSHGKLDNYEFLQQKLKEFEVEELKPKPLLSGHDLIGKGFSPGPKMGRILKEVYELQLEGTLKSKEEALAWASEAWREK
jgi:poly(A) polymerase